MFERLREYSWEKISKEIKRIVVETVEYKIKIGILTAMDEIITQRLQLALRSMNVPSGQNLASVTANSKRGE